MAEEKPQRSVEDRVIDIVVERFKVDRSQVNSKFSLGSEIEVMYLLLDLDSEFELDIPEEEDRKIHTVGDAIACVAGLLKDKLARQIAAVS